MTMSVPESRRVLQGVGWGLLLLALAALSVNRLAPAHLNADVLLQSVMSLQRVTLFYWGQNRLMNFLPLLVQGIADPQRNLYALLGLAALAHHAWLLALAHGMRELAGAGQRVSLLALFLLLTALSLGVLREYELFSLIVWHFEYSLPALLGLLAFHALRAPALSLWRVLLAGLLLTVALGLNAAVGLPAMVLGGGYGLYQRRLPAFLCGYLGLVVLLMLASLLVSRWRGPSYAGFELGLLGRGLGEVLGNLAAMFQPAAAGVLLVAFALGGLAWQWRGAQVLKVSAGERLALPLLVLFALGWLVLFAGNTWVAANAFHPRYFTWLLYTGLAVLALLWVHALAGLQGLAQRVIAVLAGLFCAYCLHAPAIALANYPLLQRLDQPALQGHGLYAGEYWQVWPLVWQELAQGRPALGLAYRGEGNLFAVRAYAAGFWDAGRPLSLFCLQALPEECVRQAAHVLGELQLQAQQAQGDNWRLELLPARDGRAGQ